MPQLNQLKIVELETGHRELLPYEQGEIVIKGPTIMKVYWNRPEETKEILRDGWIYTGGIGFMDEEGCIKIVGRKRELIKCSGFTVFPPEVEYLLYRHPAVAERAVIGIPDWYSAESPKAFLVLESGYKGELGEDEILA
jgi:long-chain acyl-CoA synthetase